MEGELPAEWALLVDRQAIVDLTIHYCWCLDEHKGGGLEAVFLPNATAYLGSSRLLRGVDAIKARLFDSLRHLDDSQHTVSNHQITIDRDEATSRCYFRAQHVRASAPGGPNLVIAGRFEDDLVRTPQGWRIKHRLLTSMWRDGNLAVLTERR